MKVLSSVFALLATTMFQSGTGTPAPATFVGRDVVTDCSKGATLFMGPAYSVICYNRTQAGGAEIHEGFAHVWYIVDGEATLVTGGTVLGTRVDAPGEIRGTGLQGGESHHLVKGSVIVIPAGLPHWYKEIIKPVAYYAVNVDKK